jgi:hypothetical protein
MRNLILNLLKVLISLGLIAYLLIYMVDLDELARVIAAARWQPLLGAALLIIAGTALRAVRWQVLLHALKIRVPLRKLVNLYFVGAFFNMFLPTGLGGDAVKMAMLAQDTGQTPEAIGTTLVDRATGLWVLFVLSLIALPFSTHLLPAAWLQVILLASLAGVVGGWLVMATPLLPWLGSKVRLPGQAGLERFYRSVSRLGYRALGQALLVSLVFDLFLIAFNVLIAQSLGLDLPLGLFFLFTPLISFSLTLPISVGGLGVREGTYVTLFAAVGVSAAAATAMSLINYVLTYVLIGLIGGLLYLAEGARNAAAARKRV